MPRSNDGSKPERHGHTWKEEEESFVLEKIKNKVPVWQIAEYVKRSPSGVYSHLKEIAFRNINSGMLLEEASMLTGVTVSDIQDFILKKETIQKIKSEKGLVQQTLNFPLQKEETILSVVIEIRELLKEILKNS